jgi:outer membrane protein OmpA-like peptidoglycan-associated protein
MSSLFRELEAEFGEEEGALKNELEALHQFEIEQFDPRPPGPGATLLTRFAFGSSTLSNAHKATLRTFASALVGRMPVTLPSPEHCLVVFIEGHEDEIGDPANFGRTGLQRAVAARTELRRILFDIISKLPAARRAAVLAQVTRDVWVSPATAGPARPIRSNVTADGQALNRRVELSVLVQQCRNIA